MKQLTKRHILITSSVALCILILYGAATGTSTKSIGVELPAASVFTQNIHLFSNGSAGFFLLSTDGETTRIAFLNNEGSTANTSEEYPVPAALDYAYSSGEIHDGEIYFYGSVKSNPATTTLGIKVTRYPLGKTDSYFDASCSLGNIKNSSLQGFTADKNGYVYALNDESKSILSIFSGTATQAPTTVTSTHGDFTSVCVSPDSYLYTTYASEKQVGVTNVKLGIPKNEPKLFPSDIPSIPYRFLNSTTVLDANGSIFNIQGSPPVFHKVKDIPGSSTASCALNSGNIVCKTGARTAEEFACDGTLISTYKFDGELLDLATNGTVTAAIVSQGSSLRFVDLSKPTTNGSGDESEQSSCSASQTESLASSSSLADTSSTPNSSGTLSIPNDSGTASTSSEPLNPPAGSDPSAPASSSTTSTASTTSTTSSKQQIPTSIQSSAYPIDRSSSLLYVGASTTFAQLKNGIFTGSATLRAVKPNGTIIESGNIGTGTVIELLTDDRVIDRLVALVKGDLVGSGNITSRDERLLYAHLNSDSNLSDVYLQAADLDGNNTVDTSDLLLLKKLVSAS